MNTFYKFTIITILFILVSLTAQSQISVKTTGSLADTTFKVFILKNGNEMPVIMDLYYGICIYLPDGEKKVYFNNHGFSKTCFYGINNNEIKDDFYSEFYSEYSPGEYKLYLHHIGGTFGKNDKRKNDFYIKEFYVGKIVK